MRASFCVMMTFLALTSVTGAAQMVVEQRRNALYIEIASSRPVIAVNYDRIFETRKKVAYSYRTGLHVAKTALCMPIGLNVLTGEKRSHFELSLVIAPYILGHHSFPTNLKNSDTYIYIKPGVGYRYQGYQSGPFLRLGAAPVLLLDPPSEKIWKMDAGLLATIWIAIGYSF